ncbi:MAG: SemiSWEET transporter [Negativicutes bacterium]|nr:SemiSWEET transporter [Negativicutes bacterium]
MAEFVGMIAGVLTTLAFFPQVVRTLRTKSTADLSASWLIMMSAGVFLWIVYGSFLGSMPIIAANIITFGCLVLLAWAKFFRS